MDEVDDFFFFINLTGSHSLIKHVFVVVLDTKCVFALVSLLQSCESLTATLSTRDWSCVKLQTDNHIGTARDIFASLAGLCHKLENQLCAEGQ